MIIWYLSSKSKGCHSQGAPFIFLITLRDIDRIKRDLSPKLTENSRCFFERLIEDYGKLVVATNVCSQIFFYKTRTHLVCISTSIFIQEREDPHVIL
jgi:hypothetical protein